MADERIEEHKHVVTETEEGTSESHTDKVVHQDKGEEKPEVTTTEKETTIEED
jgi:hypothetical protein